jgi:hypothetical protein
MLPIWIAYMVIWVVYWGYRLAFGGGLDGSGEVGRMVVSGILGTLGLVNGWLMRREDHSTQEG